MTSGKQIQPGCLAITVNSLFPENTGRVVRVVELWMQETESNQRIWTIELPGEFRAEQYNKPVITRVAHHPENWLRRIDSDSDLSDEDVDTVINHGIKETA